MSYPEIRPKSTHKNILNARPEQTLLSLGKLFCLDKPSFFWAFDNNYAWMTARQSIELFPPSWSNFIPPRKTVIYIWVLRSIIVWEEEKTWINKTWGCILHCLLWIVWSCSVKLKPLKFSFLTFRRVQTHIFHRMAGRSRDMMFNVPGPLPGPQWVLCRCYSSCSPLLPI